MTNEDKYVINFDKILGTGATALVYLGIRSSDGSQCALKCSLPTKKNTSAVLSNEVLIMRGLDHKNIIMFHESISNFNNFQRVIVMEYCNQGSLYDFAELHQGLCDNMFLRVLECLNDGIHYLQSKNLLHRDIKPGNMMVHQDFMGYYHIKLGDLGTAKEVKPDDTFRTICGTQEYLHPDLLIKHLGGSLKDFSHNVDLWSTGVTLYHAATSRLPFLPFNYSRANIKSLQTLNNMYTTKQPGIISGIQNSKNPEDVTWSDKFPDGCRLSPMLKDLASKLIGHLMDLSTANTFDRFFKEASALLAKKRLLVFNSVNGELLILYLDTLTYDSVLDMVSESVAVPRTDLIVMTRNKVLEINTPHLRSMPVKGHLRYTLTDDTLLVIVKNLPKKMQVLVSKGCSHGVCSAPKDRYGRYEETQHYSDVLLRSVYQIGYSANYIDCQLDCYLATMFAFNQYILVDDLRLMHESLPWRLVSMKNSCSMTEALIKLAEDVIENISIYHDVCAGISSCREEVKKLEQNASTGEQAVDHYYRSIIVKREMFKFTEQKFCDVSDADDNLDFLVHLAEELVNEMKVIPESKWLKDQNAYKLEVWQRHIRLFDYYNLANERFEAKSGRIADAHKYFYDVLKQGLDLMGKIAAWKTKLRTMDDKGNFIVSMFSDLIRWWINHTHAATETSILKDKINEIQDLLAKFTDP